MEVDVTTRIEQAALYRLSGDFNPLHIDSAAAASAGFAQPILHGLCSYAISARVLIGYCGGGNPDRLKRIDASFRKAVIPGQTLGFKISQLAEDQVLFRAETEDGFT